MNNAYAPRRVDAVSLRQMAAVAHPANRNHQAKYLVSIRYLRRRQLWILDKCVARGQQ